MSSKLKRILKATGVIFALIAVYAGAAASYTWKWEGTHSPLPSAHLEHRDHHVLAEGFGDLANAANEEMIGVAEALESVSISGALAVHGEQVWAGSAGLADVGNEIPASIASRYRIGSVSKSLTTTALARMVEQGLLDLDDEVQTYLPDYPRYETPMTVRQLAAHMAGVRHYQASLSEFPPHDYYHDAHYEDVLDAIEYFKADDLQFAPGLGFGYSTYGYTLLSAVMQQAAGKPFLDVMQEQVFAPLGMNDTTHEAPTGVENLVEFYNSDNGEYGLTRDVDLSIKWAGGGLVSTPSDLVTLGTALLNDRLLEAETRDEFFTVQPMFDGSENPQAYALGWRHHETVNILGEDQLVEVVHHGGSSVGGVAFLLLVPEHNISVALLSNGAGEDTRVELQLLAYRIAALVINEKDGTQS